MKLFYILLLLLFVIAIGWVVTKIMAFFWGEPKNKGSFIENLLAYIIFGAIVLGLLFLATYDNSSVPMRWDRD